MWWCVGVCGQVMCVVRWVCGNVVCGEVGWVCGEVVCGVVRLV